MSNAAVGIRLAPLTEERLREVLALLPELDVGLRIDAAWLRHYTLDDPTCLPELLLVAYAGAGDDVGSGAGTRAVGVAVACLRGERGIVKLFGVARAHRRMGVATALFDALEERLSALGAREIAVDGASPSYLLPGLEITHTEAITFLERRGYETDRHARIDMVVHLHRADLDTEDAIRRLDGEGIVIKRAKGDEVRAAAEMARETFSASWAGEVAESARSDPPGLFVALDGARVVAFAAYDVSGPCRFGPTGTDPAYRERGIGGVLLKECLRAWRDRGETTAEISWVGPIGFYARSVGARIHRVYWGFRKALTVDGQ